ncbi:delta-like protein B, partial [Patella vulgata]|uniref:delta-like protein B n=1 Tax=Patella vulgata TaxID=6465 RepID=UPI0024A8A629
FTMDAYDVISLYCERHMTGSLVSSDKPVAILTGNECVSLPRVEECSEIPCQNGGWCLEVGLSYRCHCLTG